MKYLAAVLVGVLFISSTASAADFSGLFSGSYGALKSGGSLYGGQGALRAAFQDSGTNFQFDGGYQRTVLGGVSADDANAALNVFFRGDADTLGAASIGATIRFDDIRTKVAGPFALAGKDNLTSYGAFAEFFLSPSFTLQVKGGGFSGLAEGLYGAGGARWYVGTNFALHGKYQYSESRSLGTKTYSGGLGIYGLFGTPTITDLSYSHAETGGRFGGGLTSDALMLTLTFRFGSAGKGFATADRTGAILWNGGFN